MSRRKAGGWKPSEGRRAKRRDGPKAPAASRCRDCGAAATAPRYEFFKAARPRCPACGGQLEYGGSWRGVPTGTKNQ